jgi:hypothetical protein
MPVSDPVSSTDVFALARRLRLRRRENGQSVVEIADIIKMDPGHLRLWEKSLPRKPKKELEGALEDALLVPRGWLRNPQIHPVVSEAGKSAPSVIDISIFKCKTISEEIRCIGAWLSRNAVRKRTCRIEDLSEEEVRKAKMFAERYGVSGDATLQSVGDQYGLTRERIRQIVEKMTDRLNGVSFITPCFSKLKQLVQGSTPIALTVFDENYRELLGEKLSLEDADRFSREVLGIGIASISDRSMWQAGNAIKRMVLSSNNEDNGLVIAVRDAARRMIRSCGAAQDMYVTGMVSESLDVPVSVTDVRQCIQSIEGMEWIVKDDGWFWFGLDTANNRAVEIARKVLAIADKRLDVEDIQQAICRSRRVRYYDDKNTPPMIELPRHVLCEVLAHIPWLSVVQYDDFVLKEKVQPEEVLSETELALYSSLKRNGGVASRNTLYKDMIGKSLMSVVNFQLLLASSSIIRPYGGGLFVLRGWENSIEAIQSAHLSRPGSLKSAPFLPDQNGWLEFELKLTPARFRSGVVEMPAAVVRAIKQGEYEFEGIVQGKFTIGLPSMPSRISGSFLSSLRSAGTKETDIVYLRVHPETRRVIVSSHHS